MSAATLTFGARLVTFAISIVSAILLARWLGPASRGDYAVITLLPLVVVTIANVGFPGATLRLVGRDHAIAARAATAALVLTAVASIVTALVALGGAAAIRAAYPAFTPVFLALAVLSVPQSLAYVLLQSVLQAVRAFVAVAALIVLSYALLLVALVVLVGVGALALEGAVVAWFVAHLVLAVVTVAVVARTVGLGAVDVSFIRAALPLGGLSYAAALATLAATRIALLLAGTLLPPASVGHYAVALTFTELLWYLAESAAFGLTPFVASGDGAERLTPRVTRVVLVVTAAGGVLVGLFARDLVGLLFGTEFAESAIIARLLLPGIVLYAVAKVLAASLLGRGRPGASLGPLAVGALVAGGGTLVLVPSWGVEGAAIATSVGYVVATVALIAVYVRVTGTAVLEVLVPRRRDLSVLAIGRRTH